MPNITVQNDNMIYITELTQNWDMTVSGGLIDVSSDNNVYGDNIDFLTGPKMDSIQFSPGAQDDALIIRHKLATGPVIFHCKGTADTDQRIKHYEGRRVRPFIVFSECTLSTGHSIQIQLWSKE